MVLTDMELMHQYAQDDGPAGRRQRQRALESWISAGVLTPRETHEARRVLKLLRQRGPGPQPDPKPTL